MRLKLKILLLLLNYCVNVLNAQNFERKQILLRKVFDDLVNAYGSSKSAPELLMLSKSQKESVLARYYPNPDPIIKIDEKLVDICTELGRDSLNALAFLLGHELAHYYAEHPWCSDYAFALRNSSLGTILKSVSLESKIEKESFADSKGLFYAAVAGYKPFEVFSLLIDKIYSAYDLKSNLVGYPSKDDRKRICAAELRRVKRIYPQFQEGLAAIKKQQFDSALKYFNRLTQDFPSREMYNNAGVSAFLSALQIKPLQAKEFIYPVEADTTTRLYKDGIRGPNDERYKKFNELLSSAKMYFGKALNLEPNYFLAKVNLASVYDVMGNSEASIGVLNEIISNEEKEIATIIMLKAIAYYHSDNYEKLGEMMDLWRSKYIQYYPYNYQLLLSEE